MVLFSGFSFSIPRSGPSASFVSHWIFQRGVISRAVAKYVFISISIYMYTYNTLPPSTPLAHTDIFELKFFLPVFLNSKHLKRSAFNLSEFPVTVFQQKRGAIMDNLSFQSSCPKYFNLGNYYIPFHFINLFIYICKEAHRWSRTALY